MLISKMIQLNWQNEEQFRANMTGSWHKDTLVDIAGLGEALELQVLAYPHHRRGTSRID